MFVQKGPVTLGDIVTLPKLELKEHDVGVDIKEVSLSLCSGYK